MPTLRHAGTPLEAAREQNNLSTAQVAAHIGMCETTVRRHETRKTHPYPAVWRRYAALYGVPVSTLAD